MKEEIWKQAIEEVHKQLGKPAKGRGWEQIQQQAWEQTKKLQNFYWPYYDGHFFSFYVAWVEALKYIGVTGIPKQFEIFKKCTDLGVFYPYDKFLIIGSKPTKLFRNSSGQLHKDEAPAVEYADGWKLYYLNGIPMEEWQVMTRAEDLDPVKIVAETNVDRRRELIRKIGIERLLSHLKHRVLDTQGNYTLFSVDLSNEVKDARYLKMLIPSIGVWHLEGVAPTCNTVNEALSWRNNDWFAEPEKMT